MPHAYTEEQLVEQPAMFDCFAPLGWALAASRGYPPELVRDAKLWVDETGLFGRETTSEVVWAELEAAGKMIGYYDIIVAATALERGSDVATFNRKQFVLVKRLNVIEPV